MTWLKAAGYVVAVGLVFLSGYRYAAAIYGSEIAQILKDHALAIQEKTDEYRAKEQAQIQRLASAWDELENARAESVDLRADVERVRKLADDYRKRLSSASSDACQPCRERLSKCSGLLAEGAELLEEGAGISAEIAAKKDAVVKIHQFQK